MFQLIGDLLQNDYFTGFICVLFAVNFIIALTIIFLERKTPSTALAWIMVLFLLPVLGIALYFFFSQNIARKQIFKLTQKEEVIRSTVLKQQLEAFKAKEGNRKNAPGSAAGTERADQEDAFLRGFLGG